MDIAKKWDAIILSGDKKEVVFENWEITVDSLKINFPGEYEKSSIMVHVIEKNDKLIYQLKFLDKNIWYISFDSLEIDEEVTNFFWDIDILIMKWSKQSAKIFENLETKYIVPYWEQKDIFFSTLGQTIEPVATAKIKDAIWENEVNFINLA